MKIHLFLILLLLPLSFILKSPGTTAGPQVIAVHHLTQAEVTAAGANGISFFHLALPPDVTVHRMSPAEILAHKKAGGSFFHLHPSPK